MGIMSKDEKSVVLSRKKAIKRVAKTLRAGLEDRGYDEYAYDREIFEEGVRDIAEQIVKALNYEELAELAWMYEDLQ